MNGERLVYTLSGGSAYGYAHIGVLKYLEEQGLCPAGIAGCSMGAIIGGLYAYGYSADELRELVTNLDIGKMAKLFFPSFPPGGIIDTKGVYEFLYEIVGDATIEKLPVEYRSVAVDIKTGEEIIFDRGRLIDAMVASMAIPGVFSPYHVHGRYLSDGGLRNPIPWNLANEMGTHNIVVNVRPDFPKFGEAQVRVSNEIKETQNGEREKPKKDKKNIFEAIGEAIKKIGENKRQDLVKALTERKKDVPPLVVIFENTVHIATGGAPEAKALDEGALIQINPDLSEFLLSDFDDADPMIDIGYACAKEHGNEINDFATLLVRREDKATAKD